MKVFQELRITGSPDVLQQILAAIDQRPSTGWRRDREAEESIAATSKPMYCYGCTQSEERPVGALLWLVMDPTGSLYVANIVPVNKGNLSYDEYNALLADFYRNLALPAAAGKPVDLHLTEAEKDIDAWMSKRAAGLLRQFARAANEYTGTAHPMDRERWDAFLVAAHRDRATLTASTLHRWLRESEGWPSDTAEAVAIEYESGRALLDYYDSVNTLAAS